LRRNTIVSSIAGIDKALEIRFDEERETGEEPISTDIVMKCFGFFRVRMLLSTFGCRTVQIPEDTRMSREIVIERCSLSTYHHQLNKKPGASPSDILFGSHFI
jgi:hypothetical protein